MNYSVSVNGAPVEVYEETIYPAPYNSIKKMECAMFEMTNSCHVEIKSQLGVESAVVRPLSAGIKPIISDDVISFEINKPCKLSVEVNGGYENNLVLFAEKSSPLESDQRRVIDFLGEQRQDIFEICEDNCIVYIHDDAILRGKLLIHDCENVTVCGRGRICMSETDWNIRPVEKRRAMEVIGCRNVTVRDIRISDSVDWSLRVMGSENVVVDNVKIIGCRGNSDGIDICGSKNVTVKNIFTRTWDDSFVLKALDTGDCENVTFCDSVLWNDFARSLEVGVELRADNVRNITFRNIDIIHSPTGYPLLGIHHGDRAKVRNIFFENIRIEDTPGAQLFDIRMAKAVWNRDAQMGDIADVSFKNIQFIGKPGMQFALSKSRIEGFSEQNCIRNVTLENISLLGKTAQTLEECGVNVMDYVENVQVLCTRDGEKITPIVSKVSFSRPPVLTGDKRYNARVAISLENRGDKVAAGRAWLQISPINTAEYDSGASEYTIEPGGCWTKEFDVTLQAGKYYFSVQSDSAEVDWTWLYYELDLKLGTKEQSLCFHNYYGNVSEISLAVQNDALLIKSDILKSKENRMIIYTAMPVDQQLGEVKFSVEETDFGEAPAVLLGRHGYELAPQLRCPAEITYVFKNEPKVERINKFELCTDSGEAEIPLSELGVAGNNFWLEIAADLPQVRRYRYPFTLFHSVKPDTMAHMFANVIIE